MAQTSLQKSHSKSSNAKLTLICALAALFFACLWAGVSLIKTYQTLGIIITAVGAIGCLLNFILISKFTR